MLKGYPGVSRWEQADDVLQNALIRLDRALKSVTPTTALDFFGLAAAQIRRELIDLSRHYYGKHGLGTHHSTKVGLTDGSGPADVDPAIPDTTLDPSRLASWTEFHSRGEKLAECDRELCDMLWYQGLTQAEAATILGVSERTINSRWLAARVRLSDALGGQLPI
jgi:RNA polymerase sigma-70 factor (ECF subfamily)